MDHHYITFTSHNCYKLDYRARLKDCPGLVNLIPALAYHFCLALPAEFTQPGVHLLAHPCSCLHYWAIAT